MLQNRNKIVLRALFAFLGLLMLPEFCFASGWKLLSGENLVNTVELTLVRDSSETLHVVWATRNGDDHQMFYRTVNGDGIIESDIEVLLSDWTSLNNPEVITDSQDNLTVYFSGLGPSAPFSSGNLYSLSRSASTESWTLNSAVLSESEYVYASSHVSAIADGDGDPFASWNQVPGTFFVRIGDPDELIESDSCCYYHSQLARDAVSGEVSIAWYSNVSGAHGLYSASISPTLGSATLVAGSVTNDQSLDPSHRLGFIGRAGGAGTFLAYCSGYPTCKQIRLWNHVTESSKVVAHSGGARDITLAADPNDSLWIGWTKGAQIYIANTNKKVTRVKKKAHIRIPRGVEKSEVWNLYLNKGASGLDVLLVAGQSGSAGAYHSRYSNNALRRLFRKRK